MSSTDAQSVQARPAAPLVAPPAALPPPFAALAAELRLHASDRAQDWGPVAALQALILALLARLLGRLDGLFQRWQQGQRPPPAPARPRTTPAPRPRAPSTYARTPSIWADPSPAPRQPAHATQESNTEHTENDTEATEVEHPRRALRAESRPYARPSRLSFQKPPQPSLPSRAQFISI